MGFAGQEKNVLPFNIGSSASGDTQAIAAPGANVRIVLGAVVLQNLSSTATTIKLTNGASGTVLVEVLGQNQGDGLMFVFPPDMRPKLSGNTALTLNLSGANSCKASGLYYTEPA